MNFLRLAGNSLVMVLMFLGMSYFMGHLLAAHFREIDRHALLSQCDLTRVNYAVRP